MFPLLFFHNLASTSCFGVPTTQYARSLRFLSADCLLRAEICPVVTARAHRVGYRVNMKAGKLKGRHYVDGYLTEGHGSNILRRQEPLISPTCSRDQRLPVCEGAAVPFGQSLPDSNLYI